MSVIGPPCLTFALANERHDDDAEI